MLITWAICFQNVTCQNRKNAKYSKHENLSNNSKGCVFFFFDIMCFFVAYSHNKLEPLCAAVLLDK